MLINNQMLFYFLTLKILISFYCIFLFNILFDISNLFDFIVTNDNKQIG